MVDATAAGALLCLSGLRKSYGALVVTDGLSLDVAEGEILGVLGPNGAGKTTLFNLIAGTVRPDSGRVAFAGADVSALDAAARCKLGVARSFQVPHPFGGMSVFENVLVGAAFGRNPRDPEARALKVLELTGMRAKANQLAGGLTLLDRKRLEMARALATDPKLLLLDEIAGGLTEAEANDLVGMILSLKARKITLVWIEHIVHALLKVATRLICMDAGRIIADGDPAEVMANKAVVSAYLGGGRH